MNLGLRNPGLNQLHTVYCPQVEISLVALPLPGRALSVSPARKERLSYLGADLVTASANCRTQGDPELSRGNVPLFDTYCDCSEGDGLLRPSPSGVKGANALFVRSSEEERYAIGGLDAQ